MSNETISHDVAVVTLIYNEGITSDHDLAERLKVGDKLSQRMEKFRHREIQSLRRRLPKSRSQKRGNRHFRSD